MNDPFNVASEVAGPVADDELRSLRPLAALDRRGFLAATLASGFAAAARPVSAQAISTDTAGLDAGAVRIPVGDGDMPGYRAMPAGGRRLPVVLVVNEIFGVHEYIKDVCRRFAKLGYLAVAPELFVRQGDATKVADIPTLMRDIVSKAPDAQVLRDLDATVAWTRVNGGDRRRIGVTGFCWGGRVSWLFAAHSVDVRAAVAWYGRPAGEATPLQPTLVRDVVAGLKAPVLGLYGGRDAGIPVSDVEALRAALQVPGASRAARASQVVIYPEAQHGFHADYRASYDVAAAKDGFARACAWFAQHGVAPA